MINMKDIINRDYVDGKCTRFEYVLRDETNTDMFLSNTRFLFDKIPDDVEKRTWLVKVIIQTEEMAPIIIGQMFTLPTELNLEMICATGLNCIGLKIKDIVQSYSYLDFMIGDTIRGM